MTTLLEAASRYKIANKTVFADDFTSQFFLYRTLDNITCVERLCYKVIKGILEQPGRCTTQLKEKHGSWLTDKRIFEAAKLALQMRYGNVDLLAGGLTVTLIWKSSQSPTLDPKDHLNSKLFQAILSNKFEKARLYLDRGADPNALGPYGKRPLHAVLTNPLISSLLLKRGANPDLLDDFKLTPDLD